VTVSSKSGLSKFGVTMNGDRGCGFKRKLR